MARGWWRGGWLCGGLRTLTPWRHAKKKPGRHVDRPPWDIPLITPGDAVPPEQLAARADQLRGAADEAARQAHNVYLTFLGLGTYIAVIIGSTTDVQLLKVSPVTLPFLNVQLPIVGFYVVVPWLLLLIYFNLLLHLTFLAQRLHQLNAVLDDFPDDIPLQEQRIRLFPFPFTMMLIGRPRPRRLRMLLGLMAWTTMVLFPLVLLLGAQVRFLPYHDTGITWSHRAAVLVDLLMLVVFWQMMLPSEQPLASAPPSHYRWRWLQATVRDRHNRWGAALIFVPLMAEVFSLGIAVLPEEKLEIGMASHWLFERPGAPFHRNLQLKEQVLVAGEPSAEGHCGITQ
jgi:hypothetical protein